MANGELSTYFEGEPRSVRALDCVPSAHDAKFEGTFPPVINQRVKYEDDRLGAGDDNNEIFFDCADCGEFDEDRGGGILQQQLQLFEVIKDMRNAKKFKGLLKQMALTSNIVYRIFRHTYNTTRKNRYKMRQKHWHRFDGNLKAAADKLERHDLTPLEVSNMEGVKLAAWQKNTLIKGKCTKEELCPCQSCAHSIDLEHTGLEKICPICWGIIEQETVICCKTYPQCRSKEAELNYDRKETEIVEGETAPNLIEGYNGQQYEKVFKDTNENACENCDEAAESPEPPQIFSYTKSSNKQVLNLQPVCVTIPLKIHIEGENCQAHFIETEIVMETFGAGQSHLSDAVELQETAASDTFRSCISSSSGTIKSLNSQNMGIQTMGEAKPSSVAASWKSKPSKTTIITKPLRISPAKMYVKATRSVPTISFGTAASTQTSDVLLSMASSEMLSAHLIKTWSVESSGNRRVDLGKTTSLTEMR